MRRSPSLGPVIVLVVAAAATALAVARSGQQPSPRESIRGVVLFGAGTALAAEDLRKLDARAGFAAGELDGTAAAMRANAEALRRQGIDARFVSLGHVGHVLSRSTSKILGELVDRAHGR